MTERAVILLMVAGMGVTGTVATVAFLFAFGVL